MTTTIKSILINPHTKTVTSARIGKEVEDLRAQLNCRKVRYGLFENNDQACFDGKWTHVDDHTKYFKLKGDWDYLGLWFGSVLIVGRDKDGNLCDAKSALDEVKSRVRFLRPSDF